MRIEKVVVNASPLILLCKSDLESLLPKLFKEIVVPEAVWSEVSIGNDIAWRKIQNANWLTKKSVKISDEILVWNLGDGESEVLSLAFADKDFRAMVDDRAARRCAKTLGIQLLGTGGMLVLAKRRGLIESVGESLKKLQDAGLWLSNEITELLKRQAGE